MTFEYEVDTLDGIDETLADKYIKVGDKFRLDVNGVPDVTGLKNTADARKKERDALKMQLKEINDAKANIEAEKAEAERKRLEEKGEYKTLAEKAQAEALENRTKYQELEAKVAKGECKQLANKLVIKMKVSDPARALLMNEQLLKYIQPSEKGPIISGPDGIDDVEGLSAHLTKEFPMLVDGSPAGGGGSNGSSANPPGKTMERGNFDNMTPHEKSKFVHDGGIITE